MKGDYPYFGPTGELDRIATFRLDGVFALIGEDGDHFLETEKKSQTLLISGRFNVNNHAHVIESTDYCDAEWFFNYFRHRSLQASLTRQGAGRFKLNKAALERLPIVLPPKAEQATINSLFREWDSAIEKTERLLEAKQRCGRHAMQRLFLGQSFAPSKLSDFVVRVNRKNISGNDHPLTISGKDGLIAQSKFFDKRIAAESTGHYTLLKRGEFAYNRSYSSGYPYGAIKRLDDHDEGIVSSLYLCFALQSGAPVLSDFLTYFCEAGGFNRQIDQIAQEGARNHGLLNVAAEDFFAMKMPVPDIEQQRRVVDALDALHGEQSKLARTLMALRLQKRGLMQKLLTGQWRLPMTEPEAA